MNHYERIAQLIYEGRIARLAKAIRKAEAKGNTEKVRKLFDPAMVAIKKRQRSEDKRAKDLYITTSFEKGVNARMARRKKKEQKEKEQNESFSIDEGSQGKKRRARVAKATGEPEVKTYLDQNDRLGLRGDSLRMSPYGVGFGAGNRRVTGGRKITTPEKNAPRTPKKERLTSTPRNK